MKYEYIIETYLIKDFKLDLKTINKDIVIKTTKAQGFSGGYMENRKLVIVDTNNIPLWDKKAVRDYLNTASENTGVFKI